MRPDECRHGQYLSCITCELESEIVEQKAQRTILWETLKDSTKAFNAKIDSLRKEIECLRGALLVACVPVAALAFQKSGWLSPEIEQSLRDAESAIRNALLPAMPDKQEITFVAGDKTYDYTINWDGKPTPHDYNTCKKDYSECSICWRHDRGM